MTQELVPMETILKFEPGVRLKEDSARERFVILGPEVLIELNQTGTAIMSQIDGVSSVQEVISKLAKEFATEPTEITQDEREFMTAMAMNRVLTK